MPTSVDPAVFLQLVDDVLVAAGRRPLEAPNKRIVMVQGDDRVLQILAGPGSGKTEMMVWRVLYEVVVNRTMSSRVMLTTFTRKAATELGVRLVERADQLLALAHARGVTMPDPRVHDVRVGTIHSLCDALLAEFDADYMAAGTELIDETEVLVRLVRDHRFAIGYDPRKRRVLDRLLERDALIALFRAPWDDDDHWPGNTVQRMQFLLACLGQHTETWIPRCAKGGKPNGIETLHCPGLTDDLIKVRERWTRYLDEKQVLDFTTLQLRFLEKQASVIGHLDHILVDEFQDTNPIQFAIHTAWLSSPKTRLTVVGDDDQSMYRFRGSDFECFKDLQPHCTANAVPYRLEKLEKNWRSTKAIVDFSQLFKTSSVLKHVSMPKNVIPGDGAAQGAPVRLLRGSWTALSEIVAREVAALAPPPPADPSTAILAFSSSEKGSARRGPSAARELRSTLESKGLRVYNARNKTASAAGTPVTELLGLLSYLIDPVVKAPAGKDGRSIEVWASCGDVAKAAYAPSAPPPFRIRDSHAGFQKAFMKDGGAIGTPGKDRKDLVEYIDTIRDELVKAPAGKVRLTLAGLVARLLSFPRYRRSGYTVDLFRQALFTELLESNVAPTRRTRASLDSPLHVERVKKKFVWADEYWSFLGTFGSLLAESSMDDPDVEAFEEGAVVLLTFHQSKGLEFDHVYVAGTGRVAAPHSVLQTMLFSGRTPKYTLDGAQPATKDRTVLELAEADRERELYVALTRARKTLTLLFDPDDERPLMALNPILAALAKGRSSRPYEPGSAVSVLELSDA